MALELDDTPSIAPRYTPEEIARDVEALRTRLASSELDAEEIAWVCERASNMANKGWLVDGNASADNIFDSCHSFFDDGRLREEERDAYHRTRKVARLIQSLGQERLVRPGAIPPSPFQKLQDELDAVDQIDPTHKG